MKTIKRGLLAAAVMTGLVAAAPADASYLFAGTLFSPPTRVTLTFDGLTSYEATDTGWLDANGAHFTANQIYLVGNYGNLDFNNYFSFVLGAAATVSTYTSAVLSIDNGGSDGPYPFTYSLFDVSASAVQLDQGRSSGDAAGKALFADLGSGTSYGSVNVTGATASGTRTSINLNQTFLNQVNAGLLTSFAIGGTLNPGTPAAAAVPEPAAWTTMILGMGAIGGALRRRRKAALRESYAG